MNNQAIDIVVKHWVHQQTNLKKTLDKISNEQLVKEIAPGKNTGLYLLGHIIAVNESMLSLFGLGEKIFPKLEKTFIYTPDKSGLEVPLPDELREMFSKSSESLISLFVNMPEEEWLKKHNAVSEEDFIKEPHRNKLNVLLSRSAHQSYHIGQLVLLKEDRFE